MTIENKEQSSNTTNPELDAANTNDENSEAKNEAKETTKEEAVIEQKEDDSKSAAPSISEEEIAQLLIDLSDAQERSAKLSDEKKLIYEQLMRRQAEFENFRKRVDRERSDVHLQARSNVVVEMLPVLDNLERALESAPKGEAGEAVCENILTGVKLIHRQFLDVLIGLGLSPVKALGEPFDPHMHEAVTTEANNDLPENTIVAELQKGYKLGEKLLRPAMVKVAVRG
jgi:molecular chaperone GrpE